MNTTLRTGETLGTRICLAHQYAPGSYQLTVRFAMFGLTFEAQRFVRTDTWGGACDNVDLYQVTDLGTEWIVRVSGAGYQTEGCKFVTCPPARRAAHLVALACNELDDSSARFAAIEPYEIAA